MKYVTNAGIPQEVIDVLTKSRTYGKTGLSDWLRTLEIGHIHLCPYTRSNVWSRLSKSSKSPIDIKVKTTEFKGDLYIVRIK